MIRKANFLKKRFFCSFLFSFIILLISSKNAVLLADYSLNRGYYESICENKNRPDMDCHGKCQMQKDAQKESSPINLNQFSLEFYPLNTSPDTLLPQHAGISELRARVADFCRFSIPEISYTIPVPPPVV